MGVKKAVVQRFRELCSERKINLHTLANVSGVTPSTVYSMCSNKNKDIDIITVKKLCDGLEITLGNFFNSDIFSNLEQEII